MSNTQSKSPTKRKSAKTSPGPSVSAKMSVPPTVRAKLPKSASWQEEAQNIWRAITALQYGKVGWPFGIVIIGAALAYTAIELRDLKSQNAVLANQVQQLMHEIEKNDAEAKQRDTEARQRDAEARQRDAEAQRRDMEMMHILLDFSSRLPPRQ